MYFCEFANRLHTVIGNGNNTSAFTKSLLLQIVSFEDADSDILSAKSPSTFKAYFNGKTGITRLAKRIRNYLSPEKLR